MVAVASLLIAALAPAQSLPADHAPRMAKGLAKFTESVEPLLKEKCLRCHGGDATRGGLDLATREALLAGGRNGEVVLPFDAAASRLLQLVRHEEAPWMPWKEEALDAEEIAALEEWIEAGAPYERPLVDRKGEKKPAREVTDADREFWSFRPLQAQVAEPSGAGDPANVPNVVDRWLEQELATRGVVPAPPASRRVLLRRAWFDFVGLPPPAEEVTAFLADDAPGAWERRVDALLASPHFGERWARHWLDLARYAESHGFEHDYDRPHAWPWRDSVIDALNRDQPFDEFVRWQIAGDELAPEDPQAWFATGFLGAGVHATQITMSQVEKERYDELDDVVATIGTSMLGLTVGCARCHDHKFDPIPTRDYYRMVATFTKTVRSDHDVVLNADEWKAQLATWERDHLPLEVELDHFERAALRDRFETWFMDRAAGERAAAGWIALDSASLTSSGGATFSRQDDASYLASGPRAERDEYTFVAELEEGNAPTIASLRIDALADRSLPKGGPGRADNGNFGLTELRATWQADGRAEAEPVKFVSARSTFDQAGLPATAAIDGNDAVDAACWAVDPEFGKDHSAAFALAEPIDAREGGRLTVTLQFRTNVFHSIGRLRLAAGVDCSAAETRERLTADPFPPPSLPHELLFRWYARRDPEWRARARAVDDHLAAKPKPRVQKALVCSEGLPAIRLHTQGGDFLEQTHFLQRGDPNHKLEVAQPAYLQVLTRAEDPERRWQVPPPADARTPWTRRALAAWITDVESGAGNLLARVAVNRMWQHLFGRGIVATPSDFGTTGAKPTHPELLEWLARDFVDHGFRVKRTLKLLATSAAYQRGGDPVEGDPDGALFARHPPRRLEAETIRDALLAVSGKLDPTLHGPSVTDVASTRRSIYLFVKRSRLVPMMTLFDAPNALSGLGQRQSTTVAPQALFLMNAPAAREWAEALASRIELESKPETNADFVHRAFELCFARPPSVAEVEDALPFLGHQSRADFCQALLSANEFLYVE